MGYGVNRAAVAVAGAWTDSAVVSIVRAGEYEPIVGDPDDHRPSTHLRAMGDPGGTHVVCSVYDFATGEVTVVGPSGV